MPRRSPSYAPVVPAGGVCADGVLTGREACAFARVGRTTLWAAMRRGELAWVRVGRSRCVPRRALVEWLESRTRVGGA